MLLDKEQIKNAIANMDDDRLVDLWNEYCEDVGDPKVYENDESGWEYAGVDNDFTTYDIAQKVEGGDISMGDSYITNGNELETFSNMHSWLNHDYEDLINWLVENKMYDTLKEYNIIPEVDPVECLTKVLATLSYALNSVCAGRKEEAMERIKLAKKELEDIRDYMEADKEQ